MTRSLFRLILALALLTALHSPLSASGLDTALLRANVTARAGLADSPERVVIEKIVPVGEEPAAFYAVRVSLLPPKGKKAPAVVRPMVVDATGRFLAEGLVDLGTGLPAADDALREVLRHDLPADFGRTVWSGKPGGRAVVLVSDPFCPYCRQLFNYLSTRKARLTELRLVHRPTGQAASLALCMMLDYALDHAAELGTDPWEVTAFIYGAVPDDMAKGADAPRRALAAVMERFPALKALGTPEQAVDTLNASYGRSMKAMVESTYPYGIATVPYVFVDGVMLQGFNKNLLNQLLDK